MTDLSAFFPLFAKDESVIYSEMAARANAGLATDDPGWVDTRVGSMFWLSNYPTAVAISAAYTRMNEAAAAGILATAWDSYLDLHADSYGAERKVASFATGSILFVGTPGTLIGSGTRALPPQVDPDVDPPIFETTASGTIPAPLAAPAGPSAVQGAAGGTLTSSTLHRYVITALDLVGETVASAEVNATTGTTQKQITLAWTAVAGAASYRVYRKFGATGPPYDLLTTVVAPAVGYNDNGSVGVNSAVHPPVVNGTGGQLSLAARALEAGTAGNVGANAITLPDTGIGGLASLTNPAPFAGGTEVESDQGLKDRMGQLFDGTKGANQAWYVARALEEPGVGRVTVTPLWAGAGTVLVVAMTSTGRAVTAAIAASLQARLDPVAGAGQGQAPIDHAVTVQTPTEKLINVRGTPTFKPGYSLDGASGTVAQRDVITTAIKLYLDTLRGGDDVVFEAVQGAYFNAPGVLDISAVAIQIDAGSWVTANIAISNASPAEVAVAKDVTFI